MNTTGITVVVALALGLALAGSLAASAEQFRVMPDESGTSCQSGAKSEVTTIEGPDDVKIVRAEGDSVNAAVCVSEGSKSAIHVRWKANSQWKSGGTIGQGCAEILGASKIKVRPVNTNWQESATYYTCVQQ